jgi:hypothetical protein
LDAAAIDIGLPATTLAQGVNKTSVLGCVRDQPKSRFAIRKRYVDHPFQVTTLFTVRHCIQVDLNGTFGLIQVWLIGDEADGAAYRTRTEQSALRTP